jgi:hypothetical protein
MPNPSTRETHLLSGIKQELSEQTSQRPWVCQDASVDVASIAQAEMIASEERRRGAVFSKPFQAVQSGTPKLNPEESTSAQAESSRIKVNQGESR